MKNTIIVLFTIFGINIHSQNLAGIVTYKKKIETMNLDTLENNSAKVFLKKMFLDAQIAAENIKYQLKFSNKESEFKAEDILDKESDFAIKTALMMEGGDGIFYTDLKTKTQIFEIEAYERFFLVTSNIDSLKWTITDQIKKIGKYTCYKAMGEKLFQNQYGTSYKPVEAWFTTDIPVPFGPAKYCNLPGLIVELKVQQVTFYLTKIEFKEQDEIIIKQPKKGKLITEKEFEAVGKKMHDKFVKMR